MIGNRSAGRCICKNTKKKGKGKIFLEKLASIEIVSYLYNQKVSRERTMYMGSTKSPPA